jgi:hypothetical protein
MNSNMSDLLKIKLVVVMKVWWKQKRVFVETILGPNDVVGHLCDDKILTNLKRFEICLVVALLLYYVYVVLLWCRMAQKGPFCQW